MSSDAVERDPMSPDLVEHLRRAQAAMLATSMEAEEQAASARASRGRARRQTGQIEQLQERVQHVVARADRLEAQLEAVRSSKAWQVVDAYWSLAKKVRR